MSAGKINTIGQKQFHYITAAENICDIDPSLATLPQIPAICLCCGPNTLCKLLCTRCITLQQLIVRPCTVYAVLRFVYTHVVLHCIFLSTPRQPYIRRHASRRCGGGDFTTGWNNFLAVRSPLCDALRPCHLCFSRQPIHCPVVSQSPIFSPPFFALLYSPHHTPYLTMCTASPHSRRPLPPDVIPLESILF